MAVLVLHVAACDQAVDDPVVEPKDAALMDRAIQKAKQTQSEFVAALQSPQPQWVGFAVKKPYPTPGGGHEHMWISDVEWDGASFHGHINNDAVDTTAVRLGDRVSVHPDELSDWMYIDGNRVVGGFTLRVLHYESSPQEQVEFTTQTGLEVPPVDF